MSSATKIADKDDSDDISNFIRASNDAWKAGRDFEPFLYGRDHRIYVTWTKCLLQRDEKRQEEYKHLEKSQEMIVRWCVLINQTLSLWRQLCKYIFFVRIYIYIYILLDVLTFSAKKNQTIMHKLAPHFSHTCGSETPTKIFLWKCLSNVWFWWKFCSIKCGIRLHRILK